MNITQRLRALKNNKYVIGKSNLNYFPFQKSLFKETCFLVLQVYKRSLQSGDYEF